MSNWIPTLFLLAVICLFPSWLVGCAALGAAIGLWLISRPKRKVDEPRQEDFPLPENVVKIRLKQDGLFDVKHAKNDTKTDI